MPTLNIDLPGIAALIVAAYTFYKAWKTSDAESSDKYASASSKVADQNIKLLERMDGLDKRQHDSEAEIERLKRRLARRDKLLGEWQTGINTLICQLCEKDIEPKWKPVIDLGKLDTDEDDEEK